MIDLQLILLVGRFKIIYFFKMAQNVYINRLFRHITSKFTLWWSDKLKHEWTHYCIYYKLWITLYWKKKYSIYHILVVYSYGDQRKIPYINNNTLTNSILLKRFSNLILHWHTQHTNINHISTHMVFTSRR